MPAWVYCAIMWPESTPGSKARNGFSPPLRRLVEEAVGAPLAHARHVGHRDREEVEHVADRRAVEVAVRLQPPSSVTTGLSIALFQLARGDRARVLDGVARGAVHLRGAAQRVGVLHPGEPARPMAGDHGGAGEHLPHGPRRDGLTGMRPQRLQVGGEHGVGSRESLDAHRGGEVGGGQQGVEVGEREDEHPEHAVGAVDERETLLLGSTTARCRPRRALGGGTRSPSRVAHLPLAHQRQRAVRERGQVAGAAELAVLARRPG